MEQSLASAESSMVKRNPDRRTERTRLALLSAFVDLVLERGYGALTTSEISRKANVGRSTFYLHFASKEELLQESIRHPSSGMAACVDGDVTPQQLTPLLDHFREQFSVNRQFFAYPIRPLWVKSLAALIEPRLPRAVRTRGLRQLVPPTLIALQVAEMQIALITHWLSGRYSLKSEVVAEMLIANTRALVSSVVGQ
jgi:AcrR family transcriptional regulator